MDRTAIEQVRRFNRLVAERTGTVGDRFLGTARPYGESRILWQIGREGIDVRDLRTRLGLDSGYVSRVLRSLQKQRLIRIEESRRDGRVRHLKLTALGRSECADIDRRSENLAASLLESLNPKQRVHLVAAMADVERLLSASMVTFATSDPKLRDATWCLEQYFSELSVRFPEGYSVTKSTYSTTDAFAPPSGLFIVARLRGEPVGCGAIIFQKKRRAYFKRMWLSPSVRGFGLGRRLLGELEACARSAGATTACLETHNSLKEAIAMYRAAGYREVPPFNDEFYAHHWFEKQLKPESKK
jgi:DNA-binding MarR family transcriptional regulator/GNAT superfamily N-acetyltransferase